MITENISTLKIHKLTKEQYDREYAAGNIDENALYLTPEEEIDLAPYALAEQVADIYETKADSEAKLKEAKGYTETAITNLVNSAPETLDTLGELATAFEENAEVVDALNAAITNKADKEHEHAWNELKDKPFYSENIDNVILPTSTVTNANLRQELGGYLITNKIELIEGEKYIINYNGTEYECECIRLMHYGFGVEVNFVGNNVDFTGVDTGHPFLICDATPLLGTGVGFVPISSYNPSITSSTTWEIGIVKREINYVKKLDSKFLDVDWVGLKEEKETIIYESHDEHANDCWVSGGVKHDLIEGAVYDVYLNDAIYKCTATKISIHEGLIDGEYVYHDAICLGNPIYCYMNGVDNAQDTGEPFFVHKYIEDSSYVNSEYTYFGLSEEYVDSEMSIKIILRETIYNKLPEGYLPDNITNVSWNNLQNRPFYSEMKDVFIYDTQETEVGYMSGTNVSPAPFARLGFVAGETYKVIWNGVEYTCTAFEASMEGQTGIGVGNRMVIGEENSGEPFIIADLVDSIYGVIIDLTASSSGTATVGVMEVNKEVVVKIPEKYLPEQKENLSEFNNDLYGEQYKLENVVPEGVYTFIKDEDTGLYVCSAYNDDRNMPIMNFIFAEDVETIVTFDGVKYKLKPSVKIEDKDGDFTANDVYAMGNLNLLGAGEYTGEPFIIHGTKMDGTYVATDVFGFEHTIKVDKIIGTEIKQIPKEYVEAPYGEKEVVLFPEEIVTLEDGQAELSSIVNFEVGKEYIMNINGVDYPCTAYQATYNDDMPFIGIGCEGLLGGETESLTEPCVIGTSSYEGYRFTAIMAIDSSVTSMKVSIRSMDISYIDSKYIKDMYYDNTKVILPETTLINEDPLNIISLELPDITLVSGETYIVNWNGVDYTVTAQTYTDDETDAVVLGDVYLEDTTLPFVIVCTDEGCAAINTSSPLATEVTVSITYGDIKKIDNKYIDAEWMATRKEVKTPIFENKSPDESSSAFIADMSSIKLGDELEIACGDVSCRSVLKENVLGNDAIYYIGNLSLFSSGYENTGESLLMVYAPEERNANGEYAIVCRTKESIIPEGTKLTDLSFSLYKIDNEVNKLPPEFIEDMYYDNTKVLLPKSTLTCNDTAVIYMSSPGQILGLEEGETYIVTYNEEKYECVAHINKNGRAIELSADNQFRILDWSDGSLVYSIFCSVSNTGTPYTFTIEIVKEDIHKIDEKYLPSPIPKKLSDLKNDLYGEQEVTEVIMESQEITSIIQTKNGKTYNISTSLDIVGSFEKFKEYSLQKHIVIIDGVEYEVMPRTLYDNGSNIIYVLGNSALCPDSLYDDAVVTSDPFYIIMDNMEFEYLLFNDNKTTHTVEILRCTGETYIKKIPAEYLEVESAGSLESTAIILKSPNGTRFSITIGDDGVLVADEITS